MSVRGVNFTAGVTIEDGEIVARCSCGWCSSSNPGTDLHESRVAELASLKFFDCLRHQRETHDADVIRGTRVLHRESV